MVDRWTVCSFIGTHLDPRGDHVEYGDYAALEEAYNDAIKDAKKYKELYEDIKYRIAELEK